jgi:hypothetical protein
MRHLFPRGLQAILFWQYMWVLVHGRKGGIYHPFTNSTKMESEFITISMALRDCNDSLASLHQRMDRFYVWASQLQVENRDLKQRVGFLESTVLLQQNKADD